MQGNVVIDCLIQTVLERDNDRISSIVKQEEILRVTPTRVGSTFRTVTTEYGRGMSFDGVVTS